MRGIGKARFTAAALAMAVSFVGCVSSGIESYEDFRGAVESDATCRQLIDIRDDFTGSRADEDRIADDVAALGCETKESSRNDR